MSPTEIPPPTQELIRRLSVINREAPVVDRARAEHAFVEHFEALGLHPQPVRWVADAEAGFLTATHHLRCKTWDALRRATAHPAEHSVQEQAWHPARGLAWGVAWTAADASVRRAAETDAARAIVAQGSPVVGELWHQGWSAARAAVKFVAWTAVKAKTARPLERQLVRRCCAIWRPFVEAYEAGLWFFWITAHDVIAVPRPALKTEGDRLHCPDGPAVSWPGDASYYFWRGVRVPAWHMAPSDRLSAQDILGEGDVEVRRALLEQVGHDRFLRLLAATPVHTDEFGSLYRIAMPGDEPLALVRVTNATPEPDASRREYLLRVPPGLRTARDAVAWTFGMSAREYGPAAET